MNKFIRFIQNFLIIGLPFVIILMTLSISNPKNLMVSDTVNHYKTYATICGFGMALWFASLIFYLICLIVMPSVREKTLKRLANIKERDEREQLITGKAARSAYISTLSLMIFLLFFSMFSINLYKVPKDQAIDGKQYSLNMTLGYSFFNKTETQEGTAIFNSKDIFPSTSTIILILLVWQLLAFNRAARLEQ